MSANRIHTIDLLSSRTNIAERSNNTACIDSGSGENSRVQEKERTEGRSLARIERQPESVLQDGVLRRCPHNTHHSTNRPNQADSENNPWVCCHNADRGARTEKSTSAKGREDKASTSVLEGLMEVRPLACR
jgi:hypothetical protein